MTKKDIAIKLSLSVAGVVLGAYAVKFLKQGNLL